MATGQDEWHRGSGFSSLAAAAAAAPAPAAAVGGGITFWAKTGAEFFVSSSAAAEAAAAAEASFAPSFPAARPRHRIRALWDPSWLSRERLERASRSNGAGVEDPIRPEGS